jgi:uncharacterized membrane protein
MPLSTADKADLPGRFCMRIVLLFVSLIVSLALLSGVPWRGLDPDELMHLHAACAVSWGEIPYRDFFEHHAPGLYYLLQPVLRAAGPALPALWWSRFLMAAFSLSTLGVTAALARQRAGSTAAAVAVALLVSSTIFFQKAIEVRPDIPAMFLLTLAAYVTIKAWDHRGWPSAVLVGFLLGLSTLFTQKAIVPAAALVVAQMAVSCQQRRNESRGAECRWALTVPARAAVIGLAAAAVWLVAAVLFWRVGAAQAFWSATLAQL